MQAGRPRPRAELQLTEHMQAENLRGASGGFPNICDGDGGNWEPGREEEGLNPRGGLQQPAGPAAIRDWGVPTDGHTVRSGATSTVVDNVLACAGEARRNLELMRK